MTDQYKNPANLEARLELFDQFSTSPVSWQEWIFSHFDFPPFAYLLEIGCGTGMLWLENRKRIPETWRLILGDLSLRMLQQASVNLSFLHSQAQFQVLDVQLLKYEANLFDGVIANHVLYHVPTPDRAILEAHRVLKPGGCFFAATNGEDHLSGLYELIKGYPPIWNLLSMDYPAERYTFNLENGEAMLRNHFSRVAFHSFSDCLVVTDVEPILAYVFSLLPRSGSGIPDKEKRNFRRYLQSRLQHENGKIRIFPSTGLFIAEKSPGMSTHEHDQQEGIHE